jgi:molybdenum cofactor cytidylyltransferase
VARLAGILLAAGASRRMGAPKAGLRLDGETFAARGLRLLAGAGCSPLVVVTGVHHDAVQAALPDGHAARVAPNPTPARGQLSSLKVGLRRVLEEARDVDGVVVGLVDHPAVAAATVRALVEAGVASTTPIVVPVFRGRRGHPVVFLRAVFDELLATGDELGARAVVRRDPRRVTEIAVDDPGIVTDVDTPAAFARLERAR